MFRPHPLRWFPALALAIAVPGFAQAPAQTPAPPPSATAPQQPSPRPSAQTPATQTTAAPAPPVQYTPEELGDSLEARQRYQAAIAAYSQIEHRSATVWNKMGIAYQMMYNQKEATRCYQQSLKLDPHNANVYNNLGTVYDSLKNYHEAERMYHRALKLDPQSAMTFKNLGTNLLLQHKYSKGWQAYNQAMAIDPEIFEDRDSPRVENPTSIQQRGAMNYYMARGCVRMGQTDCALQYLRMALDEGFITPKKLAADEDFSTLRNNPAFQQLLAEEKQQQKQQQHP